MPNIWLEGRGSEIELTSLDAFVPGQTEIGLIKIDVEGHESSVLEGATLLLRQKRIRDIVFEDFPPQPSPATLRLQAAGYTVFALFPTWRKPVLLTLKEHAAHFGGCEPLRLYPATAKTYQQLRPQLGRGNPEAETSSLSQASHLLKTKG